MDNDMTPEQIWKSSYLRKCRQHNKQPIIVDFTAEELTGKYGDNCTKCGEKRWLLSHVIPVAAGGTHTIDNCRPLCSNCISIKSQTVDKAIVRLIEEPDSVTLVATRRTCTDCGTKQPATSFHNGGLRGGKQRKATRCRPCRNARERERYRNRKLAILYDDTAV